jgi:hypothetical protein
LIYTTKELAASLKVNKITILRLISEGVLRPRKRKVFDHNRFYYTLDDVQRAVDRLYPLIDKTSRPTTYSDLIPLPDDLPFQGLLTKP